MDSKLNAIGAPIVNWFRSNKRQLPWREDRQPYKVWISEIMLQQTRIEAVMDYYARFLEALPDVQSLAAAEPEQLLKLWEGLGYYSRARNLQKAAQIIVKEYGGVFPSAYAELKKLPGIGEYTAGAIASICFNERVPAVDGNVLRVISRITGSRKNVLLPATKKEAEAVLREHMPAEAGDFNEGLMELGERVCLPNTLPLCERCPVRQFCTAYAEGLTDVLPVRIKQLKRKKEEKTVFILVTENGKTALEKRESSGLLAGLYQLPNVSGFLTEHEVAEQAAQWGLTVRSVAPYTEAKHIFTHIEWLMRCYTVTVATENGRFIWASEEQRLAQYPLPTAFAKLFR